MASSSKPRSPAGDGPVVGGGGVAEQHLHDAPPHPANHEELPRHRHEPVRPRVAGQAAELADQLLQVVGQVVVERHRRRLAVLTVDGDNEVAGVLTCVLEIVVEELVVGVVGGIQVAVILQVKGLGVFVKGVHG